MKIHHVNKPAVEDLQQLKQARIFLQEGKYKQAQQLITQKIKQHPKRADWIEMAAICCSLLNQQASAEAHWRHFIDLHPRRIYAYSNLYKLLKRRNARLEIIQIYQRSLNKLPQNVALWVAYAFQIIDLEKDSLMAEAEAILKRAVKLLPNDASVHNALGLACYKQNRKSEAKEFYLKSTQLDNDLFLPWSNLAIMYSDLGEYKKSENAYLESLKRAPRDAHTFNNYGLLKHALWELTAAEKLMRQALAIEPDFTDAKVSLSLLLMHQGRYEEAWPIYEARLDIRRTKFRINRPIFDFPQWQGESLEGKSILIWPEQGFGDNIQIARLVPQLKSRGAIRVTVCVRDPLVRLFRSLAGVDEVIPFVQRKNSPQSEVQPHDYWVFFFSLPLHLGLTLNNLPCKFPYLSVRQKDQAGWITTWVKKRQPNTFYVGLVWRGMAINIFSNQLRSINSLSELAYLWQVTQDAGDSPAIRFVSLQKGIGEDEARNPPPGQPIEHFGDQIGDFADTAAIINHLDLVISIDTATAHLACAMNKPCFVLLPPVRDDWRWGITPNSKSPWYPHAQLFRHPSFAGDWQHVAKNVAARLLETVRASKVNKQEKLSQAS